MAARALLYLGEASNKCIFTNVYHPKTRMQIQTSWRYARGFKRNRDTSKQAESAFSNALGSGTLSAGKLWKPLGFTIAFSGASLVTAAICEYERVHNYTKRLLTDLRSNSQRKLGYTGREGSPLREWEKLPYNLKVFLPICCLNVLVFLGWKIPALKGTMLRYFCANPSSSTICWPMLLSTFSHRSAIHLAANMFVLYSFSSVAVGTLGREQFLVLYLTSGVVSSLTSHVYKTVFAMPGLSLGASGAVMGIIGYICTQHPETMLSIVFLPMWKFTASTAIKGLLVMDTMGCILGWRFMDHAAHLGGALFGIFWQAWGSSNIWKKREPIMKYWHNIRHPPQSK